MATPRPPLRPGSVLVGLSAETLIVLQTRTRLSQQDRGVVTTLAEVLSPSVQAVSTPHFRLPTSDFGLRTRRDHHGLMKAIHAYVSGRVQAVTFRQSCRQVARSLNLVGWVRNLADGRVEVWAQGDESACNSLADWLWMGPPAAAVTGVEVDTVAPDSNLGDFFIHPNPRE